MNKKVLFICSANCDRSPTAEAIYRQHPGIETKSTGIFKSDEEIQDHLCWADVIVVMEDYHEEYIRRHFADIVTGKPVYILNIPDKYLYMQDALVSLIQERMETVLSEICVE